MWCCIVLCAILKPKDVTHNPQNWHHLYQSRFAASWKRVNEEKRLKVQQMFRLRGKRHKKYSSPQLEIILSVIIPIPAGHKASAFLFLCHIWAKCTPSSRLHWLCQASAREVEEGGHISGPWRGEGWGDKNITGNPPHLMLLSAESWPSHLYEQEVCLCFICSLCL